MRIGITGSWRESDRKSWMLESSMDIFENAARELGRALVASGVPIVVGSDSQSTADLYVVQEYLAGDWQPDSIRVVRPESGKRPFTALYNENTQDAFRFVPVNEARWRHTRQYFISEVDAVICIGGADGTYQVGLEMMLAKKRLVPIAGFGGASSRLLKKLLESGRLRETERYQKLNNPWVSPLASLVLDLAGANEPSTILLIHGHADDKTTLQTWLRGEKLAKPTILSQEFTSGQTLPEKFEELAARADAAIALATPDDLALSLANSTEPRTRARQNVWVEVGWFWGRLGRDRIMLLVRGDVERPSDLDGIIYHRYTSSPLELEEQIRAFLLHVSKAHQ